MSNETNDCKEPTRKKRCTRNKKSLAFGIPSDVSSNDSFQITHNNKTYYTRGKNTGNELPKPSNKFKTKDYAFACGAVGKCYENDFCKILCPENCTNCESKDRFKPDFIRIEETDAKGLGLFANGYIPDGHLIATYNGVTLDEDHNEGRSAYDMHVGGGLIVRAHHQCVAGLINHSCDPNCTLENYENGTGAVYVIRAKQDIESGKEITIDYREDYFLLDGCKCGVKDCKGKKMVQ